MPESISITRITLGTVVKKSVRTVKNKDDLSAKAVKAKRNKNKGDDPIYKEYQKWLRSKEFKGLRDRMLERDGYACRCCGRTEEEIADNPKISLQAHHRSYRYLGLGDDRELGDLVTLCSVCHRAVHSAKSNLRRFTDKTPILGNTKQRIDNNE